MEESEDETDESNTPLSLITTTIKYMQKIQGNRWKEHPGARGLPVSGSKFMLIEMLTNALKDNVVAVSPEKNSNTITGSKIKKCIK